MDPLAIRLGETGRPAIADGYVRVENASMIKAEDVVVRDAAPVDIEGVCGIYNTAIAERRSTFETEPHSAGDFEERIGADRFPFLVAEADGVVIGWAGLASYNPRPCYAGIGEASVYVAPEARGRGVGSALTKALAVKAEGNDFHKMVGKLFTDNVASIRLVERCGFSSVGTHRRHGRLDGEWRDVLVVERVLGEVGCEHRPSSPLRSIRASYDRGER